MSKLEIVKKANIEVVKPSELNVGDEILYSNLRCRVVDTGNPPVQRGVWVQYVHDSGVVNERMRFGVFYRITDFEEKGVD